MVEVKKEESPETLPSSALEKKSENAYSLRKITFESSFSRVQIKIEGTGDFSKVHEEKMLNPGRLILSVPNIGNAIDLNLAQFTDYTVIPRLRLGEHPDHLKIVIDTVLDIFPHYTIQKTDRQILITLEKTAQMIQEAKTKSELFLALQRNDPEIQFKLGSEDEGGVLFADGSTASSPSIAAARAQEEAGIPIAGSGGAGGVQIQAGKGPSNRITFVLDDRKEYKIFVEDTQTPIHIQKIRPIYEVKGVQSRLNLMGYDTGGVDGDVGPKTKGSLKQFQKESGIPVTGAPSKKTQTELKKKFGY